MKEDELLKLLADATNHASSQQPAALAKVLALLYWKSPTVKPLVEPICAAIIGHETSPYVKTLAYEIFQQSSAWAISWDNIKVGLVADSLSDNLTVRRAATNALLALPEHFLQEWLTADEGKFLVATICESKEGPESLAFAMRAFGSFCFSRKILQKCKMSKYFFGNMKLVFTKILENIFSAEDDVCFASCTVALQLLSCVNAVHKVTCYGSKDFWSADIAFFLGRMICLTIFTIWVNRALIFRKIKHPQACLGNSVLRLVTLTLEAILDGRFDRLVSVVNMEMLTEYKGLALREAGAPAPLSSKLNKREAYMFVQFLLDQLHIMLDFPSPATVFEAAACGLKLSVLPGMSEGGSEGFVDALLRLQKYSGGKFGISVAEVLSGHVDKVNLSLRIVFVKELFKISLQIAKANERIKMLTMATNVAVELALGAKLATRKKQFPLPQAEIHALLNSPLVENILWNENQTPATLQFREEFLVALLETVFRHPYCNLFILHKIYRLHRTGGNIGKGTEDALFNAVEWTSVALEVLEHCVSCLGWSTSNRIAIFQSYLKLLGHTNLVLLSLRGFGGSDYGEHRMQVLLGKIAQVIPKLPIVSAQLRALWVVCHHLKLEQSKNVKEKRIRKNWKKILNSMNQLLASSSFKAAEIGHAAILDFDADKSTSASGGGGKGNCYAGEAEVEIIVRRLVAYARHNWQLQALKGVLRKYCFEHPPDTFLSKCFETILQQLEQKTYSKSMKEEDRKRTYSFPFDLNHELEYNEKSRTLDSALYLTYHAGISKTKLEDVEVLHDDFPWVDVTGPGDPIYGMAKHEIRLTKGNVEFFLRISLRNQLEVTLQDLTIEILVEGYLKLELENSKSRITLAPHEERQMIVRLTILEFCDAKVLISLNFLSEVSFGPMTPFLCMPYCITPAKQIIPSVWEENFYSFDLMWSSLLFGYFCECSLHSEIENRQQWQLNKHNLLPNFVYTGQRLFDNCGETLCQQYYIGRTCDAMDIAIMLELKEVHEGEIHLDCHLRSSSRGVMEKIIEGLDSFLDEVSHGQMKLGKKKKATTNLRQEKVVEEPGDELDNFIFSAGPAHPTESKKINDIAQQLAGMGDLSPEAEPSSAVLHQKPEEMVTVMPDLDSVDDPVSNIIKMFDAPHKTKTRAFPTDSENKFYSSESSDDEQRV